MFMKALLLFVPVTLVLVWQGANPSLVFLSSCLAIVPLSSALADLTEELAEFLGPTKGSLMTATLGNAPELIIGGFTLSKGLIDVVKASIAGSILMNMLLLLGVGMIAGGLRRPHQVFNANLAGMSASMMTMASIGLIVPTLFKLSSPRAEQELSLEIAVILFVVYLLSLLFTLVTHRQLFARPAQKIGAEKQASEMSRSVAQQLDIEVTPPTTAAAAHETPDAAPARSKLQIIGWLALTATVLAVVSEIMTDALDPAMKTLGLSEAFAGVIVLASLGNVAQLFSAVRFARNNDMDLVMGATVGASTQAALVLAPFMVFLGVALGQPMDLLFTPFEVMALTFAVLITGQMTRDGQSNWMEGTMLVAVYLIFAFGLYYSG
jgi:Ca2+:H+ antiporter